MQYIYSLETDLSSVKKLLGANGASLAEMSSLSLPIPKGFVISSEVCNTFLKEASYPGEFYAQLDEALASLEEKTSKQYASSENPLLLSLRVGSSEFVPGLMETVLNLGLNDEVLQGLIKQTNNPKFAYDTYQRFVFSFATTVLNLPKKLFLEQYLSIQEARGVGSTDELGESDLRELVSIFKAIVQRETGENFPDDPEQQLKLTLEIAFQSWMSQTASIYRKINGIEDLMGAALTVQAMVYGNKDKASGTGIMLTRNPQTGENQVYGEYLMESQGGDLAKRLRVGRSLLELKLEFPRIYEELVEVKNTLESYYKDAQEVEFTIEQGNLYLLNTKKAKRRARADLKIATDLVKEGLLSEKEALLNIEAKDLDQLLHPSVVRASTENVLAVGFPASPGAATGQIVFTTQEAIDCQERGEKAVLFAQEITPSDISGLKAAVALVTSSGGITGQASVIARKLGKACVSGCSDILIDPKSRQIISSIGEILRGGEIVTVDGRNGQLFKGEVTILEPDLSDEFKQIIKWADKYKTLGVRANSDTLEDCKLANEFGAEGIGLVRTEHIFFMEERVSLMQEWLLSTDSQRKNEIFASLLTLHRKDVCDIFLESADQKVVLRLLDTPLYDFFNVSQSNLEHLAAKLNIDLDSLLVQIKSFEEVNPMLSHRGARVGVTHSDIYKLQVQAIVEAALDCQARGVKVLPEIMIPMLSNFSEMKYLRSLLEKHVADYLPKAKFDLKFGVLMEIPRACITADEIAEYSDFISFGTNDLTQTTYGLSRNDSGKFIADYFREGIITSDPALELDEKGVGRLMRIATQGGRSTRPELEVGICGEHGGDPKSIDFCHRIGLDYISCSPFRIPIAKVAAAQAAIRNEIQVD